LTEIVCDLCGDPTDGYCCQRCAGNVTTALGDVVGLAGEVETTVARLARYAVRAGQRAAPVDEEPAPKMPDALRPTPLPVDLHAAARAAVAFNAVTTWARHCSEQRGIDVALRGGEHPAACAAAFLLGQVEWLRHQPEAEEAFPELEAAGVAIRRVVDAPPERQFVGRCPCGEYLYAHKGASTVTCVGCRQAWDVETSRRTLMEVLRDRLVTPAEAATLAALLHPGEQRGKLRDLIRTWGERGHLGVGVPSEDGVRYPFGVIVDRVTRHVVAKQERRGATVTA
jgi:hypothetical protein